MDLLVGNRGFSAEAPDCDNGTSLENCTWLALTTIGTSSGTGVPPSLAERDEMLVRAEIAVQASIFVMAVAGNGLVLGLLATMSRRKELGRMYTMIGHLSCADFFVAVFNLLPQLLWDVTYRFRGGRVLCKLVKYAQLAVLYASSFVLVATAVDRYTAICHPMLSHAWTSAAARRLVAVAWTASLVLAIPQLVIFDQVELDPPGSGVHDCWEHFEPRWTLPVYVTWFAAAVYVIPLGVLGVIYTRICTVVWRSAAITAAVTLHLVRTDGAETGSESRKRSASGDEAVDTPRERGLAVEPTGIRLADTRDSVRSVEPRSIRTKSTSMTIASLPGGRDHGPAMPQLGMSRAKAKTVKLTLTVIVSYAVCWGPFFVAQLWSAWDPLAPFEGNAMVIILLLASLNSCTNPWIYMVFSDHLRRRVRRLFRCYCCGLRRPLLQRRPWLRGSRGGGSDRERAGGHRAIGEVPAGRNAETLTHHSTGVTRVSTSSNRHT